MKYFLAKSEPSAYSIADLRRDGATTWDGVRNPQALQAIRSMAPGDRVFIYHSTGESAVVGLAEVVSPPRPDPTDAKLAVVDIRFVLALDTPVALAEVKQSGKFNDWALVRQGRLSTMECPATFVDWMRQRLPNAGI